MPYPIKYFWKDRKGASKSSWGIELTEEEKYTLAKKNNALIRGQLLEQRRHGKENSSL